MTTENALDPAKTSHAAFVGFDSAWAGNPKAPGAICSVAFDGQQFHDFLEPRLVDFEKASDFVEHVRLAGRPSIVAVDQPTAGPNKTGMRPVERVAASLISWTGGGVQPPNQGIPFLRASHGGGDPRWGTVGRERDPAAQLESGFRSCACGHDLADDASDPLTCIISRKT